MAKQKVHRGKRRSTSSVPEDLLGGLPAVAAAHLRGAAMSLARGDVNAAELSVFAARIIAPDHPESLRIAAAVFTGVPIVAIGWTLRTVPGPTLRVVLRRHPVLGLRLLFLVLAVIAGLAGVAGATAGAGVTGPLLVLGVIVLTLLGWMTGA